MEAHIDGKLGKHIPDYWLMTEDGPLESGSTIRVTDRSKSAINSGDSSKCDS
jgi:hypothetical protein